MDYGVISLVPTALVLFLAIWSHRTLESVIAGSLLAFVIMDGIGFIESLAATIMTVVGDVVTVWIVLVCGLYGPFIALLVKGGGSYAFGQMLTRRIRGKKASLLTTWVLGLSIFLDDYLNSLTVGATMKSVTDRFKVSREMLAYVVDSTAAPMCLLIPISSWAVYFAGLLEKNGVAGPGEGIATFVGAIPFMFYPIVALLVVPLAVTRIIPLLGRMRTAEMRAEETGDLGVFEDPALAVEPSERGGVSIFFVPIIVLLFFTVFPTVDLLRGVIIGILGTLVQYSAMRIMPLGELLDTCMDGLKSMVPVLTMLIALFVFVKQNFAVSVFAGCCHFCDS